VTTSVLTGIVQFVYCALVGTFPFNAFLSGFISTVGSFVLTGTSIIRTSHAHHTHTRSTRQKGLTHSVFLFSFSLSSSLLSVCLRIQVNPVNQFSITPERAFVDFVVASLLLHLTVFNFIG
jgi:oligosaccharyltransferase complex subunit epsilon